MKTILSEQKAQTSLEYLIILGGAILVATMVTLYLKSIPRQVGTSVESQAAQAQNTIPQ